MPPAIAAVAGTPMPAQRARRVTGRGDRRQVQVAEPDDASVPDDMVHARGREGLVHPGLRIADARRAGLEDLRGSRRGVELRAGQLLQPPDAADMVDMLVAVQQDLHVARGLNPRARDVAAMTRSAPASVPASMQDMPRISGDQDGGDSARARPDRCWRGCGPAEPACPNRHCRHRLRRTPARRSRQGRGAARSASGSCRAGS